MIGKVSILNRTLKAIIPWGEIQLTLKLNLLLAWWSTSVVLWGIKKSFSPSHCAGWRRTEGKGPAFMNAAMRAGLCCASETMGADGWPAADVAKPVTDACERVHPPMESISAAWQGPDRHTQTHTHTLDTEAEKHTFSSRNGCIIIKIWMYSLFVSIFPLTTAGATGTSPPYQTM